MNRDDVLSRLTQILAQDFRVDPARITAETHLRTDLGLDSLALVDLMFLVQKDFAFKAAVEEFHDTRTVGKLVDLIASKVAGKV